MYIHQKVVRGFDGRACRPDQLGPGFQGRAVIVYTGERHSHAPREYGPAKTLYNRWKRWGDMGVFARIMEGLAAASPAPKTIMIDATYLKAYRTATSLRSKKGGADV